MANNVNLCRVWMGREEVGGVFVKDKFCRMDLLVLTSSTIY